MAILFQHTAARRRLRACKTVGNTAYIVSTHSRAEAAAVGVKLLRVEVIVSTHSRAEAAANEIGYTLKKCGVSTHSRAEAAAYLNTQHLFITRSFNTQPRGGGCLRLARYASSIKRFNTQPRGGGCSLPKKARKISVLNTVFR